MLSALRARAFVALWLGLAFVGVASVALAHRGSAKRIFVERTEDGVSLEVFFERVDVAVELGLPESASEREVLAERSRIRDWLEAGIRVEAAGAPCAVEIGELRRAPHDEGVARMRAELRFACPTDASPVVLHDETIFGDDPQHEAYVRTRFGGDDAHVLRAGRQSLELGAPPSRVSLFMRFLVEGMWHLVSGYDHLLFLLSLLLTAGGLAAREGFRRGLKDVVWLVTAFTIGHSVTLVAAALEVVVLPEKPVEVTIAFSIIVVAALNIARPRERGPMPWLGFAFGLIHGFGFSGVLAELGLPADARVLALLAFNAGIELAQVGFVALALGPLMGLAKMEGYERWVVRGGSVLIALLALAWMVERLLA